MKKKKKKLTTVLLVLAVAAAVAQAAGAYTRSVVATAYCLHGTTATGHYTVPGTVAVDPRVIPLYSTLYVPGYGFGRAWDTGGAIRGSRIDVWYSSCARARSWGVRRLRVRVR